MLKSIDHDLGLASNLIQAQKCLMGRGPLKIFQGHLPKIRWPTYTFQLLITIKYVTLGHYVLSPNFMSSVTCGVRKISVGFVQSLLERDEARWQLGSNQRKL